MVGIRQPWVQIQALPFTLCVTWRGNLPSETQFPNLERGRSELNPITCIKCLDGAGSPAH